MKKSKEKDEKELNEISKNRCEDIFATVFELQIILNVDGFRKWLAQHHQMKDDFEVFEGYRFMLKTLIGTLIESINSNSSFNLKEDFVFHRAMRYADVKIDKLPITCEKAIFIKNLYEMAKPLWKSQTWDETERNGDIFSKSCLSIFDTIFEHYIEVSDEVQLDKRTVLYRLSCFYTMTHLTDTQRGTPNGYIASIFTTIEWPEDFDDIPEQDYFENLSEEDLTYSKKVLFGYKYALQYIWFSLLEKEIYEKTVSDMHQVKDWARPDFIEIDENGHLTETKNKKDFLDGYYSIVNEHIVSPMMHDLKVHSIFLDLLKIDRMIPKETFSILLSRKPKNPIISEKEALNAKLFWYPAEVLEGKHVFNGVPAFIAILSGLVESRRMLKITQKVFVARFKHPEHPDGYNYSYGILIEAVSNFLSDYSGWLIFYDCATDYSGFGGYEQSVAETFFSFYKKQNIIEEIEVVIQKEIFLKYLEGKVITSHLKAVTKLENELKNVGSKFAESKGLLLELLLHYILSYGENERIEWNYKNGDVQMDLFTKKGNMISFYECKVPVLSDWQEECLSLKRKVKGLLSDNLFISEFHCPKIEKQLFFCFWERPPQEVTKVINENGMGILILSELLGRPITGRRIGLNRLHYVFSKNKNKKNKTD
jgi:hypothetical protein